MVEGAVGKEGEDGCVRFLLPQSWLNTSLALPQIFILEKKPNPSINKLKKINSETASIYAHWKKKCFRRTHNYHSQDTPRNLLFSFFSLLLLFFSACLLVAARTCSSSSFLTCSNLAAASSSVSSLDVVLSSSSLVNCLKSSTYSRYGRPSKESTTLSHSQIPHSLQMTNP